MRALITGVNGFVGRHLARHLASAGHSVRGMVRRLRDCEPGDLEGVELVEGDVTQPKTLPAALAGVEVVFHLAGIRRSPERAAFFAINAEGTRNVCEAMLACGTRRLVFAGSLAASGPSLSGRPKLEEDPFSPTEWYGESKALAESIALGYGPRLEVAVARPARIVGPGDKENLAVFKMIQRGIRIVLGGGPRPYSFVDISDVVRALHALAERPEALGQAFFIAHHQALTLEEVQDLVARELGARPRTLALSPGMFRVLAAAADVTSRLSGRHLPLNRKLARQMLAPAWTCSIDKARRILGFSPEVTIAESVARSAEWYQARGWL